MLDNEQIGWWKLGHALFRVLDETSGTSPPVLMAVPVGFPIVEATYSVQERIPQDIGLIRRYVLDGVCRFGPCSSVELDGLLGLGADVIEQTLVELSECVPGLLRDRETFRASSEARRAMASGEFSKVVVQQRKFVVNGLGDALLPIDFWRHHEEWRLYPNPEHPVGPFLDAAGQSTQIAVKIRDRMGNGREDLQQRIDSNDPAAKALVGLPRGGFGVASEPESVDIAWVTSFLVVSVDGAISVLSPHRPPLSLLDTKFARKDYLIQICDGLRPRDIDQQAFAAACDSLVQSFDDCADLLPGDGPGEVLVRMSTKGAREEARNGPELDESIARPSSRLTAALVRGRYWDHRTRFILKMRPADADTAERVAVQRAIRDLRAELRSHPQDKLDGNPFDVKSWWTRWQEQFIRNLPKGAAMRHLSLDALLRAADDVRDTEFAERLERCIRNRA